LLFLRLRVRFASSLDAKPLTEVVLAERIVEEDATPDELSNLQDISRMPKKYRDRMLHALTPPPPLNYISELHQKAVDRRALYGKFGRKSGVDPGVMWPTPDEELVDMIEYEKEWEPSLQERWHKSAEERKVEAKERRIK